MKKVKKSIFRNNRVKKDFNGFFVSIFLILCMVVGTGMKKAEGSSLFLTIRMFFCQEQGELVGGNFVPQEETVYSETAEEYASSSGNIVWHQIVADSVNNLADGDITLSEEEMCDYALISSCKISDNLEHIEITAEMEQIPSSDLFTSLHWKVIKLSTKQ